MPIPGESTVDCFHLNPEMGEDLFPGLMEEITMNTVAIYKSYNFHKLYLYFIYKNVVACINTAEMYFLTVPVQSQGVGRTISPEGSGRQGAFRGSSSFWWPQDSVAVAGPLQSLPSSLCPCVGLTSPTSLIDDTSQFSPKIYSDPSGLTFPLITSGFISSLHKSYFCIVYLETLPFPSWQPKSRAETTLPHFFPWLPFI